MKTDKADETSMVDIYKRYRFVRQESDQANESQTAAQKGPKLSVQKKTLNIPICDIKIDEEYGSHLAQDFSVSIPYVKYVKRIDDIDPLTEYYADKEDQNWLSNILLAKFPDEREKFTLTKFEHVIGILERTNGTTRDTIPQTVALKAVYEKSGLDSSTVTKILPELYKYWYSKRDKQGKPLNRKFWPPTTAGDTNPHQVFRVRDRERYKLRRQHRRNDMDSFRKMQQLRKEFQQAKSILQLMLEREQLNDAQFRIQREIFLQKLRDAGIDVTAEVYDEHSSGKLSIYDQYFNNKPIEYEPSFKHLWMQLPPIPTIPITTTVQESKVQENDGNLKDVDVICVDDASHNGDSISLTQPAVAASMITKKGAGRPPKNPSIDGAVITTSDKKSGLKRKKSLEKNKASSLYTINGNGEVEIFSLPETNSITDQGSLIAANVRKSTSGVGAPENITSLNDVAFNGYLQPSFLESNNPIESLLTDGVNLINELVEGPNSVCRPNWPHFFAPLSVRDQVYSYCTPTEYMQALEFRYDENYEPILPTKFRSRCRIGRNGRLIVDRIPVYGDSDGALDDGNDSSANHLYQYPVSLRPNTRWLPNYSMVTGSLTTSAGGGYTASTKLTAASLHAHNNNNVSGIKGNSGGTANGSATTAMENDSQNRQQRSTMTPKVLPELPLSNRKLLLQSLKRNNKVNHNNWSSSLPMTCPSIPPLVPPPRIALSAEKISRLNAILADSDSEDERLIIPKTTEGFDIDRSTNSKTVAAENAMTKFIIPLGSH